MNWNRRQFLAAAALPFVPALSRSEANKQKSLGVVQYSYAIRFLDLLKPLDSRPVPTPPVARAPGSPA